MSRLRLTGLVLIFLVGLTITSVLLSGIGIQFDPFHTKEKAISSAVSAMEQALSANEAVSQADRYAQHSQIIREKADASILAITQAPHASDPLPDDVRGLWLAGLRDGATPEVDNHRP